MDNLYINEIEKIRYLCTKALPEYGRRSCFFTKGMTDSEITDYEQENNTKIPSMYKEWLRFSEYTRILFDLVVLTKPYQDERIIQDKDLLIIGRVIGDGEIVCLSCSRNSVILAKDGHYREYANFSIFLDEVVIRLLIGSVCESSDDEKDILKNLSSLSIKDKTRAFNKLSVDDRKKYLNLLQMESQDIYDDFIMDIRRQAILDYWWHERESIKEGNCTRNWNPDQIESIMNISTETGMCEKQAGRPN